MDDEADPREKYNDLNGALQDERSGKPLRGSRTSIPGLDRLLLVIDDYEALGTTLGDFLISSLIPRLAVASCPTMLSIAGRDGLEVTNPGWGQHCKRYLTEQIRLQPFDSETAEQMMAAKGVAEGRREATFELTQGFPLLLSLAIEEASTDGASALFLKSFFDRTTRYPDHLLGTYRSGGYNPSMKSSEALRVLAELSASQWGMLTTAQAATHGVERLDLSRLAKAGHLERLAQGVYRDAGAPADEFEGLRAAWLAADPSRTAETRLRDLVNGIVVMGASAASLHSVGDLPADRHELSSPIRRQTQRSEVSYRQRQLEPDDVTIAQGLPVTTIERTIADLVEARTDLSLVSDVLRNAVRVRNLDTGRLADLLSPLAARNGHRKDDGAALLDHLTTLAGLDEASLAEAIGASEVLSALITANNLARFNNAEISKAIIAPATQEALEAMNQSVARSLQSSMAPALDAVSASIADSPAMIELREKLAEISKQVAQDLPIQDLFASFGKDWAAALAATTAISRSDALRTLRAPTAVEVAELVAIDG